jgi:hypothetical protein
VVHLLLGDERDLCCSAVRDALEERGDETRIVPNPLVDPACFSWRLDNERSLTSLAFDGDPALSDDEIASVLVRSSGWVDPAGWQPTDLPYVQAETQSALLAWLWSLGCPVVNRFTPAIWYRPQAPLLAWRGMLARSGLATPETLVTNAEDEAREFGRRLHAVGVGGAVYGPLTSDSRYLIAGEEDWRGLRELQRLGPVCLSAPHGAPQRACVVGEHVVWDGEPAAAHTALEPSLRRFANDARLALVALIVAPAPTRPCVVAVEAQPRLDEFGRAAQEEIVDGIVELLTGSRP